MPKFSCLHFLLDFGKIRCVLQSLTLHTARTGWILFAVDPRSCTQHVSANLQQLPEAPLMTAKPGSDEKELTGFSPALCCSLSALPQAALQSLLHYISNWMLYQQEIRGSMQKNTELNLVCVHFTNKLQTLPFFSLCSH